MGWSWVDIIRTLIEMYAAAMFSDSPIEAQEDPARNDQCQNKMWLNIDS